jgi:hypothetical protein
MKRRWAFSEKYCNNEQAFLSLPIVASLPFKSFKSFNPFKTF